MSGMHTTTGRTLKGLDHLQQSISDILSTPIGSRLMRRDYGSRLFELIDLPTNHNTLLRLYAATAEALDKWEPRIKLSRVQIHLSELERGTLTMELNAQLIQPIDDLSPGQVVTIGVAV